MEVSFVTAAQVSSSLAVAQVYLAHRAEDLAKFEKGLVLKSDDTNVFLEFENGYKAILHADGNVTLMNPNNEYCNLFKTYRQFCAYYLAKFW